MADLWYHGIEELAWIKQVNFSGDALKVCLVSGSYTPDVDHSGYTQISGDECPTLNGYIAGGVTVTGYVVDQDSLNNVKLDISDPTWVASGGAIGPFSYGILYDDTPTYKPLVYLFDFGGAQTAQSGANITIQIDASGLVTIG